MGDEHLRYNPTPFGVSDPAARRPGSLAPTRQTKRQASLLSVMPAGSLE